MHLDRVTITGADDSVAPADLRGGACVVPGEWPRATSFVPYQGYAGGLGPDTLERELPRIAEAAKISPIQETFVRDYADARIWIDMERRVRSDDDTRFDLDKVRRCLEICAPFIKEAEHVQAR